MSGFLLSICNDHKLGRYIQGGPSHLKDKARTKRSKCNGSIELNTSLQVATANGVGEFSRLMRAITWTRAERTRSLARCLESLGPMLPHALVRDHLATCSRPDRCQMAAMLWPPAIPKVWAGLAFSGSRLVLLYSLYDNS